MSLNPPERILRKIKELTTLIDTMDGVLGDEVMHEMSAELHRIINHVDNTSSAPLAQYLSNEKIRSFCVMQICSAAVEVLSAFNSLRIGAIPASKRAQRAAVESMGVLSLLVVDRFYLEQISKKDCGDCQRVINKLKKYRDLPVFEMLIPEEKDGEISRPMIESQMTSCVLFYLMEHLFGHDPGYIKTVRFFLKEELNPAAHASFNNILFYLFGALEDGSWGNHYSEARDPIYINTSQEIINVAKFINQVLDSLTQYLTHKKS